jgi:signal transduction histidine kinase
MKQLLSKRLTQVLSLVLSAIFLQSLLRHLSSSYNYYMSIFWGNILLPSTVVSVLGLVVSIGVFVATVIVKNPRIAPRLMNHIDLSVLLFSVYFMILIDVIAILHYVSAVIVVALTLVTVFVAAYVFEEVYFRIRTQESKNVWRSFFENNRKQLPIVVTMILLLLPAVIYFVFSGIVIFNGAVMHLNGAGLSSDLAYRVASNLPFAVIMAIYFVLLTNIVTYLENQAEYNDAIVADKIKAEQFKAELITNMSHDMKTPLTSVINYVDLLGKLPIEDAHFQEYTDVLQRKTNRLKQLIQDLLDASKVGTGNVEITLQTLNLNELLGQMVGEFEEDYSENQLTLVYKEPSEALAILADGPNLYRVMENLLGNSLKYSMPNTRVFLQVEEGSEDVTIDLHNTSKYPLELTSEALTEQFMRGDQSRHTEGSGLGLYIAKNLVELMGGTFKLSVKGDLFQVQLSFPKSSK